MLAALPGVHPLTEEELFERHVEVRSRPNFFTSSCREQVAFFVRVGVLLSLARASERALVLEFRVDGFLFVGTVCTHELRSTTLVFVQDSSCVLEVAAGAALHTCVGARVAGTEPTLRAG